MGGDTLESMQQWRPTILAIDATIWPELIGTVDPMLQLYCIFLIEDLHVNLPLGRYSYPYKINNNNHIIVKFVT